MSDPVPCPLAKKTRRGWGCGCQCDPAPALDLSHYRGHSKSRSIAHRLRMLSRYKDGTTLAVMAKEEGVSIKRVHDILLTTMADARDMCSVGKLLKNGATDTEPSERGERK